jgi:hypothetical protein
MWLSQSALDRIRELELALRESVSRDVYERSLARIAELERRNDWAMSMLLRRAGSLPVPDVPTEAALPPQTDVPAFTETQMAQAEAVVEYAREHDLGRQETEQALRTSIPGITEEAIAQAIAGRVM